MAMFGASNQLIQIDSGNARTYFYNSSLGIALYAGLGENQVLGQRFFAVTNATPTNPSGCPAIYMLVQYASTAKPAPVAGPAPVYWTDNTFTTVTGVFTEALLAANGVAGYLMPNTTDITGLTAAMLQGAQVLIQVGGYLKAAWGPTAGTPGAGNAITGSTGNFTSTATAAGTAPVNGVLLGIQMTAIGSGLCDILVKSDII